MENKTQYLLTGIDPGNSDIKVSYLSLDGEVEDLSISTCIAIAPSEPKMQGKRNDDPTDWLHVEISASNGAFPRGTYYVGPIAKLSPDRIEATEGNNKATSDVHLITMIVGEAVAALLMGYTGSVKVPPSCGLPVADIKARQATAFLGRLRGTFTVRFIDGKFKGQSITIVHEIPELAEVDDYIHAEAIQCTLGLGFQVKNFELVENEMADLVDQDVVLSDAGGGTFDIAVYENESLNPEASRTYIETLPELEQIEQAKQYAGKKVGANEYIDEIMKAVVPEIRAQLNEMGVPTIESTSFFRGRNDFITKVLKPYTLKLKEGKVQKGKPEITFNIMGVEIDLTKVVKPHLETYGNVLYWTNFLARQQEGTAGIATNIMTGGGVLLGYVVLKDREVNAKGVRMYHLPNDLFAAPFTNARGYLYSAMLTHTEALEELKQYKSATV
ncbi:hypothetical protein [Brevibacillus centrosporus]|uniref:hypothetical protein n=1 Tax=Brevibacillus centrosporus TaxID=54910 RepID=UPI003B023190